jgi:hypothetical protein
MVFSPYAALEGRPMEVLKVEGANRAMMNKATIRIPAVTSPVLREGMFEAP